jgi:hypothetical protein
LIARLSPTFNPRPQIPTRTVNSMDRPVGLIPSIVPVSSTIPVNITCVVGTLRRGVPGRVAAAGTFANHDDQRPALRRYCAAQDSASAL